MAGNYMDAPAPRVAYDRDGSVMSAISAAGDVTTLSQTVARVLNGEGDSAPTLPTSPYRVAVVFSVPRDMSGIFFSLIQASTTAARVETSKNTTNGVDGTWEGHGLDSVVGPRTTKPEYRRSVSLSRFLPGEISRSVRGVRITVSSSSNPFGATNLASLHLYGEVSATATTDRLALWHPTLDQAVGPSWFDWGDVPRSSSADRSFRIKNLSSTLAATSIDVSMEALTPGVPSVVGMHTFSNSAGGGFVPSLNIPRVNPGAVSPVITVRRTVPATAQISTWSARIVADVTTWTE